MGNLFAELKRRHIYRVAAAYAVVAWVLIQLVNNVAPMLRTAGLERGRLFSCCSPSAFRSRSFSPGCVNSRPPMARRRERRPASWIGR